MSVQKKIKFLILIAILIVISLCTVVTFQIVNITKAKKQINNQQQQIQRLENQLDSFNKTPDNDYEEIS